MTDGRDRISARRSNIFSDDVKIIPTLKRKRRMEINYQIHTVGPFPFHKDRTGPVISLKARHHRIYTAWATY